MKKKRSKRRTENEERIRAVIESSLDSWSKGPAATRKPAPLIKRWSIVEREAILDYLCGDVPRGEVKACCYYEYSRTSGVLRKARREILRKGPLRIRRKLQRKYDSANVDDLLRNIGGNIPTWLQGDSRRLDILICPAYPKLPWRELREAQRREILEHFVKTKPLLLITPITQSFILNSMGIFDRFKQQAMSDEREWRKQPGHYPAMVGDNQIKYVVLPFNYAEGKKAIKNAFSRWLDTDANRKLFKKYYKKAVLRQNLDSSDRYKELLKYLAAWRLYDELRFKKAAEWTKTNRRQRTDASGIEHVRPFFREMQSKRKHAQMLVLSPLYKEQRDWKAARRAAQSFLQAEIECGGMG